MEGHLRPGDEITHIDGLCVIGSSHRKVVQLMTEASGTGRVTLRVRRRNKPSYPYDVTMTRSENEGFGFVIISTATRSGSVIGEMNRFFVLIVA